MATHDHTGNADEITPQARTLTDAVPGDGVGIGTSDGSVNADGDQTAVDVGADQVSAELEAGAAIEQDDGETSGTGTPVAQPSGEETSAAVVSPLLSPDPSVSTDERVDRTDDVAMADQGTDAAESTVGDPQQAAKATDPQAGIGDQADAVEGAAAAKDSADTAENTTGQKSDASEPVVEEDLGDAVAEAAAVVAVEEDTEVLAMTNAMVAAIEQFDSAESGGTSGDNEVAPPQHEPVIAEDDNMIAA
jgi:hypothetical protein